VSEIGALDGVADVHHVHAWSLTSNRHVFSAHIRLNSDATEAQRESALNSAYRLAIEKAGFFFATIQVETTCLDEKSARDINVAFDPKSTAPHSH
jgi:cobalt-zinc-cadmium efflux system protein